MCRVDLEYNRDAVDGCAKKIPIGILHDSARVGLTGFILTTEVVEHLVGSRSSQFVYNTAPSFPAIVCCAIKVPVADLDRREVRIRPIDAVRTRTKSMKHGELAGWGDSEDRAAVISPYGHRAVEIPVAGLDDPVQEDSVPGACRATTKGVDGSELAIKRHPVKSGRTAEAVTVRHSIESSVGAENGRRTRIFPVGTIRL